MADTIKIGNLDISAVKVGQSDCKLYLGDTLLYPQSQPQTLQWVEFNSGDTIPQSLDIYGISGTPYDFYATFGSSSAIGEFTPSRNRIEISLYCNDNNPCYSDQPYYNDNVELIFSNIGCCDYYNQGAIVSGGDLGVGVIKLYIYA